VRFHAFVLLASDIDLMFGIICRNPTLLAVTGIVLLSSASAMAVTTSYHIGNSLTYDSQPLALEQLAASRGTDHRVGYHIHANWSMQDILANPEETSFDPSEFGTFTGAFANYHWDAITLQPHRSYPTTQMRQDVESILTFIDIARSNPANAGTNFYIYQAWPEAGNYQLNWLAPSPDGPNTVMTRTREYYNHLIERVRAETDANVFMVPVGDVLYEIDVRIRNKTIPGFFSVNEFYRDGIHLSSEIGRYVASMTTYSTILGQYPNELEKPEGFFEGPRTLTPQQEALLQETIRDVLDKHAYSGVDLPPPLRADFNHDNRVNEFDLAIWEQYSAFTNPYDLNGDHRVNGRDFLEWQRGFQAELSPEEAARFALSDLNDDGVYNSEDIHAWQASFGIDDGADLDGDGDTDGRDLMIWQRNVPSMPGDIDNDFLINAGELQAWQDSYGFSNVADANGDGAVDMADYQIWQAENGRVWTFPFAASSPLNPNQVASQLVVPEPNAILICIGVASIWLSCLRRI
jgi:hypothetical protein